VSYDRSIPQIEPVVKGTKKRRADIRIRPALRCGTCREAAPARLPCRRLQAAGFGPRRTGREFPLSPGGDLGYPACINV